MHVIYPGIQRLRLCLMWNMPNVNYHHAGYRCAQYSISYRNVSIYRNLSIYTLIELSIYSLIELSIYRITELSINLCMTSRRWVCNRLSVLQQYFELVLYSCTSVWMVLLLTNTYTYTTYQNYDCVSCILRLTAIDRPLRCAVAVRLLLSLRYAYVCCLCLLSVSAAIALNASYIW